MVPLLLCAWSPLLAAGDGEVQLMSTPAGATVCRKVLDREECLGKTPLAVDLASPSGSTQKFIFKKLGYRTRAEYIDRQQPLSVTLEKASLLPAATQPSLRELQGIVNARLSNLIYSTRLADDGRLEILGPIAVARDADRSISLRFAVAVSDYTLLRQLKAASRARHEQRFPKTLRMLDEAGVFKMFDAVRKELDGVPLDRVSFDAMYVRSAAYLQFDERQRLQQQWVGTRYTSTEQIDTYIMYWERYDVTEVRDSLASVSYSFQVDKAASAVGLAQQLDKVLIITNDTPGGKYVRIAGAGLASSDMQSH